jgi:hypothetical protein
MPIRNQDQHYLGWVHREIDNLVAIDAQGGLPTLEAEDRVGLRLEWYDVIDRYLAEVAPVLERLRLCQPDPEIFAGSG